MSGFANFNELTALVVDYAHHAELLERCQNVFVPMASVRIGRDLRSRHNEDVATLDGAALGDPMPVPADFGSIRSLSFINGSRICALSAKDEVSIRLVETQGNVPRAYNIQDSTIIARPFKGGDYLLSYHTVPVLDDTVTTNDVLTNYPQLYLYAALLELHVWTQDSELRAQALDTYKGEFHAINRQQARARMNAPAAVGV